MTLYLDNKILGYYEKFTITENLDRTLNTIVVVVWDLIDQAEPIKPKTPFIISDYNGKSYYYVVNYDLVEVASRNPIKYKHTLTCVEGVHELNSIFVRNSTFLKSQESEKLGECNFPCFCIYDTTNHTWKNQLALSTLSSNSTTCYTYMPQFSLTSVQGYKGFRLYFESDTMVYQEFTDGTCKEPTNTWLKNIINSCAVLITRVDKVYGVTTYAKTWITINASDIAQGYHELTSSEENEIFENINYNTIFYMSPYEYNETTKLFGYDIYCDTSKLPILTSKNPLMALTLARVKLVGIKQERTLLDVLNTLINQSYQTYNNESKKIPQLTFSDNFKDSLSVTAPDFSFTGKTLFECINEILNYIDAIPKLYYDDENGKIILDCYFVNDSDKESINSLFVNETLLQKFGDIKSQLDDKYFNNRLINQYQNGTQQNSIFYPSKGAYRGVSSTSVGVLSVDNCIMEVPYSIERIDSLKVYYGTTKVSFIFYPILDIGGSSPSPSRQFESVALPFGDYIDITRAVFENSAYSLLPTYNADWTFPNTNNTLSYNKGGKYISMNGKGAILGSGQGDRARIQFAVECSIGAYIGAFEGFTYRDETNQQAVRLNCFVLPLSTTFAVDEWITDVKYQVEYHALYNGQVAQESTNNKYNGDEYINQSNGQIVLEKLGINTKGLISQLGNAKIDVNVPFDTPIELGMWFIDKNNNRYIANVIQTQYFSSGIAQSGGNFKTHTLKSVQFTKDFNSLSTYTQLDSTRRFYDISSELTTTGYQNLTEFIYISLEQPTQKYSSSINTNALLSIINKSNYKVDFATLTIYENISDTEYLNLGKINDIDTGNASLYINPTYSDYKSIEVPLHCYGFGNSICFEANFDSDIKGGTRITSRNKRVARNVIYTNPNGYFAKCDLIFTSDSGTYIETSDFPLTNKGQDSVTNLISIKDYAYYKRPSEIFATNFELCFLPYNCDCYFGSAFINNNNILRGGTKAKMSVYNSGKLISILDDKLPNDSVELEQATISTTQINETCLKVAVQWSSEILDNQKSIIIANENNEILIAFNLSLNYQENGFVFYIFASRFRL